MKFSRKTKPRVHELIRSVHVHVLISCPRMHVLIGFLRFHVPFICQELVRPLGDLKDFSYFDCHDGESRDSNDALEFSCRSFLWLTITCQRQM